MTDREILLQLLEKVEFLTQEFNSFRSDPTLDKRRKLITLKEAATILGCKNPNRPEALRRACNQKKGVIGINAVKQKGVKGYRVPLYTVLAVKKTEI
jgi:hypothetical protein